MLDPVKALFFRSSYDLAVYDQRSRVLRVATESPRMITEAAAFPVKASDNALAYRGVQAGVRQASIKSVGHAQRETSPCDP